MKAKKWMILLLILVMSLYAAGCDSAAEVYVQSVAELTGMGGIAPGDRFVGLVVSEHVAQIQKDGDRTIAELLVKEGDDVKEGDPLFSYDTDELQLNLDKQRLELEQLLATIDNCKSQIADLEKQSRWLSGTEKLEYTVQIQTLQVDLKEAELKVKSKETEIARSEEIMENATVTAPVTGRVQSVSEKGTDNMGNPLPYITIQQSGSYRIKGMLGELQRGGIIEGTRMRILSRTDDTVSWTGTVTLVDYENPSQGNSANSYYGTAADEMTAASRYPFYVALDSTEGLILGQHVYLELDTQEGSGSGLALDAAFVCYEEDGSAYVWAEDKGRLEKRTVTVGEEDPMTGTVSILEGLSLEDYIAFPDSGICAVGAPTTHEYVPDDEPDEEPAGEEIAEPVGEELAEPAGEEITAPAEEVAAEPAEEEITEPAEEVTAEPSGEVA